MPFYERLSISPRLNPRQNFNFLKLDPGLSQKKQNFEASLWFRTKNDEFQFKAPPRLCSSKWCFKNRNLFHQRHSRCKKRETSWADSSSEYLMKISCGSVGNECARKKSHKLHQWLEFNLALDLLKRLHDECNFHKFIKSTFHARHPSRIIFHSASGNAHSH